MASERNRVSSLVEYIKSLGIEVNLEKNKAQGHRGFFKAIGQKFRIDISKGMTNECITRTLIHEFAHYIHFNYDKSLKSLEFIFGENWNEYLEDLINLTVDIIPKSSISPLFDKKIK